MPHFDARMVMEASAVPVAAGQMEVRAQVTLIYALADS